MFAAPPVHVFLSNLAAPLVLFFFFAQIIKKPRIDLCSSVSLSVSLSLSVPGFRLPLSLLSLSLGISLGSFVSLFSLITQLSPTQTTTMSTGSYPGFGIAPGMQAEAPKKPHLYIGNLSPRVTDYMLTEIFAVAGPVVQAKIIQDRNFQHGGLNYGFVEYTDMRSAEQALQTLNGRKIFDAEVRVNWAYQGTQTKEDTQHHYHVFVGDLSPEVNDDVLAKAFGAFGSMSEARVMWDMNSGKSRGYGFLSFREKPDAEQAIATMNGEWLGSRAIRVNWANQKTQTGGGRPTGGPPGGGGGGGFSLPPNPTPGLGSRSPANLPPAPSYSPAPAAYAAQPTSFDAVAQQAPDFNTTVYVGNLIPYTTQADLIPLFQGYGYIVEIRMQADRGFAFVKLDTHQNAAMAIANLQNTPVHGRPIKCSWGKDKAEGGNQPGQYGMAAAQPQAQQQMGYPYNQYYGGYGYGQTGVPGQPGQTADTAGAQQAGWDQAAAAYYGQGGQGWGGFYQTAADGQQAGQNGTH
ncbi:hypothetical protein BCR39DRAFT_548567 [Naematelia encephala]|uniref:RRM domain-containing protein n=1 Tax=Naematelia encephala TaxID=71784 RepID=A0A1Y2ANL6_9TREE|nr:hypothetical protein BCR39DRAFT_548567 [Naematelia encephala]